MDKPLRHVPPSIILEFTVRTVQSRFLLRPSESTNDIVLGIFGRALEHYPGVALHALSVLSNHMQGIVSAEDGPSLSGFMCFVNGNIARKIGRNVNWRESFWGRRYRSIPILDEASQVARLKYILSQGVQEGLVPRPELWPGVHSVLALTEGVALRGTWYDQTQEYFARRAGETPDAHAFATSYEVRLTPLPCWKDLTEEERRCRTKALVEELVTENQRPGRTWLGVDAILRQNPHKAPAHTNRSPAPICHAATKERWAEYRSFYRELVSLYESVSFRLRRGLAALEDLPAHCFPPPLPWRQTGPGPFRQVATA